MRERVLVGLKGRLVTPRLVGEFVRAYVAEINAANRECGARQATLTLQEQAKLGRQIRKSATPWNSSRTGRAVP